MDNGYDETPAQPKIARTLFHVSFSASFSICVFPFTHPLVYLSVQLSKYVCQLVSYYVCTYVMCTGREYMFFSIWVYEHTQVWMKPFTHLPSLET